MSAVRSVLPASSVGKILIQRDETTEEKRAVLMYSKLPKNIATSQVLLLDPMLATGGSAASAIEVLRSAGVPEDRIIFINLLAAPEGIAFLKERAPAVKIVTAAIDSHLNSHKYIIPGLGDFGDRYFGTD